LQTHSDVLDLLQDMLNGLSRTTTKENLRERSRSSDAPPTEAQLDLSVDLGFQLLTMFEPRLPATYTGREHITWAEGSIFDIKRSAPLLLGEPRTPIENLRLEASHFNAHSLARISKFAIFFTTNLADHLELDQINKRLYIFHHASFLEACRT